MLGVGILENYVIATSIILPDQNLESWEVEQNDLTNPSS